MTLHDVAHLLVTAASLGVASAAGWGGTILHVDDDAPPGGDGSSWGTAYRFLRDALHAAPDGAEVRVAQGVYLPDRDEANPAGTGDRAATFDVGRDLSMLGGYAGLVAKDPDERDPERFESIMSGDLARDDDEPDGGTGENAIHVVTAADADHPATLDGLVVTAGNAFGEEPEDWSGGGVRIIAGSPLISRCAIRGNHAWTSGGGIFVTEASPRLLDCVLTANEADDGGAICSWIGADVTVTDSVFRSNNAGSGGGAISGFQDRVVIAGCTFEQNYGGIVGGAIRGLSVGSRVEGCVFLKNAAGRDGGAINVSGPADILRCTFRGNTVNTGYGGAVDTNASGCNLVDCVIDGNHARHGGGLAVGEGVTVVNCMITGNVADHSGGGFFVSSDETPASLVNCTVAGNVAVATGGGGGYFLGGAVALDNTIIWRNQPDAAFGDAVSIAVARHCNVRGGWAGTGHDNIDGDPLFVDPAAGDFRLAPGSPAIDAGANAAVPKGVVTDLAGNNRFADEPCVADTGQGAPPVVDLGAYEHTPVFVDCNENGVRDQCDILAQHSDDNNGNGVPDECEPGQYVGPDGGDWLEAANWSSGTLPEATTFVTIPRRVVVDGAGAVAGEVAVLAGGALVLAGGALTTPLVDVRAGGEISGAGTIHGDVFNRGTMRPGRPMGVLTINGNCTYSADARLEIEIAGPELADHDQLVVTGDLRLDGQLVVAFVDPFGPRCYDNFDIVTYAIAHGEFAGVELSVLPASLGFGVVALELTARLSLWPWAHEIDALRPPIGANFGQAIALDGDVAVVGERLFQVGSNESTVHFFRFDGSDWQLELSERGSRFDAFATAVAVDGDVAVVGEDKADFRGNATGAAYVYRFSERDGWVREAMLTASDAEESDQFGHAVGVSGDAIVVSTRDESAYVFRCIDGTWAEEAKLTASDGEESDDFGGDVAIQGDLIVAGARGVAGPMSVNQGAAYVYRRLGGTWIQTDKLDASDGASGFGWSVALDGDTILAGVLGANENAGGVYAYRFDGAAWVESRFAPSDVVRVDQFGYFVDLDGDVAVVGQIWNQVYPDDGLAWIFRRHGERWVQGPKLRPATDVPIGPTGYRVEVSGDIILVANAKDAGVVYVFDESFADCNDNGDLDACEIAGGTSDDENDNGVPDECESCPGDLDGDGAVDFGDIVAILTAWGQVGGPEDLDGSGTVDFGDVLVVLATWGPCP